jgi:hypothetical protein
MTVEHLTDQQIEEKARLLQKMLCNDQRLFEQLKLLVLLERGGEITLFYSSTPGLHKVKFGQQL